MESQFLYYKNKTQTVFHGDCYSVLQETPDNEYHACVTDPPYGLSAQPTEDVVACLSAWIRGERYQHGKKGFKGKSWDGWVPGPDVWKEVYRTLKPGAFLLAFAGTRTFDLTGIAIRLAGFEVRDEMLWLYRSGFLKTGNIATRIDDELGVDNVAAMRTQPPVGIWLDKNLEKRRLGVKVPTSDIAKKWDGWTSALAPAYEPILVARKPCEGRTAANVIKHSTGVLNANACAPSKEHHLFADQVSAGYLPCNVIIDEEVADSLDNSQIGKGPKPSRYFYCAKADKQDKGETNTHLTVKPTSLMRYLVRLACMKGGLLLDPFAGSGSTLVACEAEGIRGDGIELDDVHCKIIKDRLTGKTRTETVQVGLMGEDE